jgi:formylglycine-generating enzyme required for sulfatase activity
MDDGGYEEDRFWDTEEARLWLHGDEAFVDQLYRHSRTSFDRDFQPELADHRHSEPELLNSLRLMAASRTEPFFWRSHRLNRPNQPVVGVNWWEARAYCRWLTLRRAAEVGDGLVFRLPTEHEWERATRPDRASSDYPWGDMPPDGTKAHYRGGDLSAQRATPVGAFPAGAWDGGPLDLAGNVWEWTASKAIGPSADEDEERNLPVGMSDRVVRGGSWYSLIPTAMRTSYRGVDRLQNVYVDLGFRIAASFSRARPGEPPVG